MWALKLYGQRYVIKYLPRKENAWVDVLTRWHAVGTAIAARATIASLYAPVNVEGGDYDCPTKQHIIECQESN